MNLSIDREIAQLRNRPGLNLLAQALIKVQQSHNLLLQQVSKGAPASAAPTTNGGGAATFVAASNQPATGVSSLNGKTGAVTLVGGTGVSISPTGNSLTLTSPGSGGGVNPQSANYTLAPADDGQLIEITGGSPITLAASPSALGATFYCAVQNSASATVTITPSSGTIDGAGSATLSAGQGILLFSDGTNLYTLRGAGGSGTGAVWPFIGFTPPDLTGFSWVNQGGAAYLLSGGILTLNDTGAGGQNIRYLKSPTAVSDSVGWTVIVAVAFGLEYSNAVNWSDGIAISDGTKYKLFGFDHQTNVGYLGTRVLNLLDYSNATTYASTAFSTALLFPLPPVMWLKVVQDATHRTYFISTDPVNIGWTQVFQESNNAYLAETSVGYFLDVYSGTVLRISGPFLSWQQTSP